MHMVKVDVTGRRGEVDGWGMFEGIGIRYVDRR
jgi:hypothetical protein